MNVNEIRTRPGTFAGRLEPQARWELLERLRCVFHAENSYDAQLGVLDVADMLGFTCYQVGEPTGWYQDPYGYEDPTQFPTGVA